MTRAARAQSSSSASGSRARGNQPAVALQHATQGVTSQRPGSGPGVLQPALGNPAITLPGRQRKTSVIEAHGDDLSAGIDQEVRSLLERREEEAKNQAHEAEAPPGCAPEAEP
jgi:hypothetical protein